MLHWPFLYPTSVNSKEDKGKPRLIHIITLEVFVISYFLCCHFTQYCACIMTFKVNGKQVSQGDSESTSFLQFNGRICINLMPVWSLNGCSVSFNILCRSVMTEEYKVPDGMVGFSKQYGCDDVVQRGMLADTVTANDLSIYSFSK